MAITIKYNVKYGAKTAFGQHMYIDDEAGIKLIREYLERE